MFNPPSPPVTKKPTPWGLIVLILAGGFLLVGGLCAFGGYQFMKVATSKPQPRKYFGEVQEVGDLGGGWKTYQFRDVPMRMELPTKPEKEVLDYERGDGLYTKEWIFYRMFSEYSNYDFSGFWYRSNDLVDQEYEEENAEYFAEGTLDGPTVSFTFKDAKYGQLSGREGTSNTTSEGRRLIVRCFLWKRNESVFAIISYTDQDYERESKVEFERMLNSIQMD